jgi:hypothetical protein
MKKIYKNISNFILLPLIVVAFSANAQTKNTSASPPAPTATGISSIEHQWEYLVVSYGKTLFGTPEKTLAYRSIGLSATAQEANEIQQSLDVLGRFGWEVITIVGTIGGDQQIVMKRRYDKNRVTNESLAILRGRELYLKDLIDILERGRRIREESETATAAEKNKPRLIDLDVKERDERRESLISGRDSWLKSQLSLTTWGNQAKSTIRSFDADGKDAFIDVTVDLTEQMLKNGNNYRASEVKYWLNNTAIPMLKTATSSFTNNGSVNITVIATINFNGKSEKVGESKTRYSDVLRRWAD